MSPTNTTPTYKLKPLIRFVSSAYRHLFASPSPKTLFNLTRRRGICWRVSRDVRKPQSADETPGTPPISQKHGGYRLPGVDVPGGGGGGIGPCLGLSTHPWSTWGWEAPKRLGLGKANWVGEKNSKKKKNCKGPHGISTGGPVKS